MAAVSVVWRASGYRGDVHHCMLSDLGACRYSYPACSSPGKTGGSRVAMRKVHMKVEGADITVHECWTIS